MAGPHQGHLCSRGSAPLCSGVAAGLSSGVFRIASTCPAPLCSGSWILFPHPFLFPAPCLVFGCLVPQASILSLSRLPACYLFSWNHGLPDNLASGFNSLTPWSCRNSLGATHEETMHVFLDVHDEKTKQNFFFFLVMCGPNTLP